jgi:hypothetical protein
MDRRDRLRPFPAGAACTACGATVPTSQMRILARRDDVAFVELTCRTCGSESLGLLIAGEDPEGAPVIDVVADGPRQGDAGSRITDDPISAAHAAALADHLRAWDGDLVGWLDAIGHGEPDEPGGWVVDR